MNKKILLTGASGFTGRHFIELANSQGYECVALRHRSRDNIAGCTAVVVADFADKGQLKAQIEAVRPNYVVHLAAISFVAHGDVSDIYSTNLLGTLNLLDCLIELALPIEKVLIASSGLVYGNNNQLPINESMAPAPVNDYSVSKYEMELAAYTRFDKLPLIIVRPFNYTGVGQAEHFLIPKIIAAFKRGDKKIELGNLDVARDFSDVRDVVVSYIRLLQSKASSDVFNVCTGQATSLLSVIERLNELANYQIQVNVNSDFVRSNEIKQLYGCPRKLQDVIGDYRQYQLADTLQWMYQG
jgi:nucleoside-diphosphate-sugar epimerase